MKNEQEQKQNASGARKIGRAALRVLAGVLCCVMLVACVTGGIMLAQFAGERSEYTRAHLFDWIENVSAKLKGQTSDVALRQGTAEAPAETPVPAGEPYQQMLLRQVKEMADYQAEMDRLMLEELHSGAYTLDEPFVLLDPYGVSPLTAVLLFTTEEPVRIDIHIAGDTPQAEVDFAFSDYETEHMIPVYGLYADRENTVTVTATDEAGNARSTEVTVQTDVLPDAMSEVIVHAHALDAKEIQPGFTFTYRSEKTAFKTAIDIDGQYRWYLKTDQNGSLLESTGYCGDYNDSSSFYISCGTIIPAGPVVILEMNYMGKLLNAWYSPYGAHHDIEPDEEGLLVTGSSDAAYQADFIYHVDRASGDIDKSINFRDYLQVQRNQCEVQYTSSDAYFLLSDWAHINTVVSYEDDIIVSLRNQSTVLRTDWDGNIKWMLCDPTGYYEYYKQFILTPVGDNFEYCYVQHAPEVMPDQDGDPDTVDILLFDNGDWRMDVHERTSRMIQYRINEKEMTVELIRIWGSDRPELYTCFHGDADLLKNGNWMGSFQPSDWRLNTTRAYCAEVAEDGHVVWEMWRETEKGLTLEYRLDRLPIYAETANDLHIGEQANLFLPEE